MKILVAFPDIAYYNWQVLVQINNLVKFGYANDIIYVVGKQLHSQLTQQVQDVLDNTPVEYHVYDDTRIQRGYPSSLRPHIISKYFIDHPEMKGETFFYIDPDLLFAKSVSFGTLLNNDTWYVSDTRSYIDSNYIKSKGDQLFTEMCKKVKIDPSKVIANDANAGGAQYLMKNIDCHYWVKVANNAEKLYKLMKSTEHIYNPSHPIQSWTADMWSVLWNAWYNNHTVKIASRLSFSWATDSISQYDNHNLFHNAGVSEQPNLFNKIAYQTNPFDKDFSHVSNQFCSYKYVEEIEETKVNYPELIKLF